MRVPDPEQDFSGIYTDATMVATYDTDDRMTSDALEPRYPSAGGQGGIFPSQTDYTYDPNGNTLTATLTKNSGQVILSTTMNTWDIEGHLVRVVTTDANGNVTTTTDFAYDAAGDRVAQRTGGVTTSYLNDPSDAYDRALEEYSGTSNMMLAATYVRGLDLLFQDRTGTDGGSTGRSFYAVDGLGSTRALVNTSGVVTDTIDYEAYGTTTAQTTFNASGVGTTNSYWYAGQGKDATGLYYNRARYYDAAAGRFTSRDGFEGEASDPITTNHYIYASADPVDHYDPSGHFSAGVTLAAISLSFAVFLTVGMLSRNPSYLFHQSNAFIPVDYQSLRPIDYQSIRVRGARSAQALFDDMKKFKELDMGPVTANGNISFVNQHVSFDMNQFIPNEIGQGDFSVRVTKINETNHYFVVRTVSGHPLAGWRYWGVRQENNGDLLIETFAVEHTATVVDTVKLDWLGGKKEMLGTWTHMLKDLVRRSAGTEVNAEDSHPNGIEINNIAPFYHLVAD